ncbi:hypothetical protein K490DRAFT_67232 [Saccharata proteae CBS 121410]|uniref:Ima1 N-terminal domain-containing protein n=1 Tax=Saccharata proteae CBS 121410 TaxID=1314787 RepID=A0A9P4HQD4_9PEZI|nr:hypothetical protein K490DRAFT_67232 [Saccharata proteae CBS 121410]
MGLLSRKLTCFYCGTRSEQKQDGTVRQFYCKPCDSINYLDENGEITDPPASDVPRPERFAKPLEPTSLDLTPAKSDLFCGTCLKNQHLYTQNLATYLPAPNDPLYAKRERDLPAYKKELERRYEQVCRNCAPRVQERIRKAGYAAKTDHLRRMMERMRSGATNRPRGPLTVKSIVVWFAGLAWWTSVLLHVGWHVLGALTAPETHEDRLEVYAPHGGACFVQAAMFREVEWECVTELGQKEMRTVMLLGLLSFWWNGNLAAKLAGAGGRLVRIHEHLIFQALLFAVRAASWWYLQSPEQSPLPMDQYKSAHLTMAVIILITAFVSTTIVKLDHTPRVSFTENYEPLHPLPPEGQSRPTTPGRKHNLYNNSNKSSTRAAQPFTTQSPSYLKPFPVNKLAQPIHLPPQPSSYEPPSPTFSTTSTYTSTTATTARRPSTYTTTTNASDDDEEAMDWTPTRPATNLFSLESRSSPPPQPRVQTRSMTAKSPFYGHLPAAPKHAAYRRVNPAQTAPLFRKAPEYKQKDFFGKMMGNQNRDGNTTPVYGGEDEDGAFGMGGMGAGLGGGTGRKGEISLKPPQMRIKEEAGDTGLEGLFNAVFSIRDEPVGVGEEGQGRRGDGDENGGEGGRGGVFGGGAGQMGQGSGAGVGVVGQGEGSSWWVAAAVPFAGLGVFWALEWALDGVGWLS